jgi:arsenate reductase
VRNGDLRLLSAGITRNIHLEAENFANPAVTVGRIFSDTFAGIAPASAMFFIAAQLVGGVIGLGLVRFFFPDAPVAAGRAVVPHPNHVAEEG